MKWAKNLELFKLTLLEILIYMDYLGLTTNAMKTTTLLVLKLLVSSVVALGSTSWGFHSQEEEGDGVGGCCCCYNDAPPLPPQSQHNKLSREIERGKEQTPPKKTQRENKRLGTWWIGGYIELVHTGHSNSSCTLLVCATTDDVFCFNVRSGFFDSTSDSSVLDGVSPSSLMGDSRMSIFKFPGVIQLSSTTTYSLHNSCFFSHPSPQLSSQTITFLQCQTY